jgi:hypothetical protein
VSGEPDPKITLAALRPTVPFLGLGLVLFGVRTAVYGLVEGVLTATVAGLVAVLVGAATAVLGFRANRRPND